MEQKFMVSIILHPLMPLMYTICAIGVGLIAVSTGLILNQPDD